MVIFVNDVNDMWIYVLMMKFVIKCLIVFFIIGRFLFCIFLVWFIIKLRLSIYLCFFEKNNIKIKYKNNKKFCLFIKFGGCILCGMKLLFIVFNIIVRK